MGIPLPNLDDKTFHQLMDEAKALIPRHSKNWTNFNPSDPGITLLELFAWINESIIYRQNKITSETRWRLVQLLASPRGTAAVDILIDNSGGSSAIDLAAGNEVVTTLPAPASRPARFVAPAAVTVPAGEAKLARFYNLRRITADMFTLAAKTRDIRNQLVPIEPTDTVAKADLGNSPLIHHPDLHALTVAHLYGLHTPPSSTNAPYQPTLSVQDDMRTWVFVPDLLASHSDDPHFTFDYHRRALLFGDNVHGAIPAAGKTITLGNLWVSDGAAANVFQRVAWTASPSTWLPDDGSLANIVKAQGGRDWYSGATEEERLDEAIRDTLAFHRERPRAVTRKDYAALAMEAFVPVDSHKPLRVDVLENFNIDTKVGNSETLNHLSIAVIDDYLASVSPPQAGVVPDPSLKILDTILGFLEERRQLTTRLHAGLADLVRLDLNIRVKVDPAQQPNANDAILRIKEKVQAYFDPETGGVDGKGRRVGQPFFASEIFNLLEAEDFVEFVDRVHPSYLRAAAPQLDEKPLQPHELLVLIPKTISPENFPSLQVELL